MRVRCRSCGINVPGAEPEDDCPACETERGLEPWPEGCTEHLFLSVVDFHYLAPQVVAVAQTRIEGTWKAYIDAVGPYTEHEMSVKQVLERGTALPERVARVLFQRFVGLKYAP